MYAVFKLSGFQYQVEEGAVVKVPLQEGEKGTKISIDEVLLVRDNDTTHAGTPLVADAKIEAEIVQSAKDEKVLIHKYKRRTKYRRTQGHRQDYTEIKINKIIFPKS